MLRMLFIVVNLYVASSFLFSTTTSTRRRRLSEFRSSSNDDQPIQSDGNDEQPILEQSSLTIDDHGSNLTDRFKYKVNALMGNYDPISGTVDDEQQNGNIISALKKFPTTYCFTVVGRTSSPDDYEEQVTNIVSSISGDAFVIVQVKPRGTKFTRVTVEAQVESSAVINSIYEELDKMEQTIMKY